MIHSTLPISILLLAACAATPRSAPAPTKTAPSSPRAAEPLSSYAVGYATFTVSRGNGRELPAAVWYPAEPSDAPAIQYLQAIPGIARAAAPVAGGGPFPVVALSHGSGGVKESAAYLAERLAAAGYIVAAVDHIGDTFRTFDMSRRKEITRERPRDISALLDYLAAPAAAELRWLAEAADLEHVAVYGHSFGGYTALALAGARVAPTQLWRDQCAATPNDFACALLDPAQAEPMRFRDPRVDVVIPAATAGWPLFGADGTAAVETPVLLLTGGQDVDTPTASQARPIYDHLRTERWLIELSLGTHYTFIHICPFVNVLPEPMAVNARPGCAPDAPLPVEAAHDFLADVVVTFVDASLRDRADARAELAPDRLRARAAGKKITVETFSAAAQK